MFLAHSAHGRLSSRVVHDIDLLIDVPDAERAGELLESRGLRSTEILGQERLYRNDDLQIEADLHWQLAHD